MITLQQIKQRGIKFSRTWLRWLPARYMLETSEFDDNGNFWRLNYRSYLLLLAAKLDSRKIRVILGRDEGGRITYVDHSPRYRVIKKRWRGEWYCTLIKTEGEEPEDESLSLLGV